MQSEPVKLDEIKSRLVKAGYPHPGSGPPSRQIRDITPEARAARAELRDHIIGDVWALLDEVELLRQRTKP